ncbi:MAG: hypothetical protein ACKVPX_18120, partial [Myxococcaceae bacterium]
EFRHLMPGSEPAHVQIVNNTFDQTISGFINIGSIDMPTAAGHLMWNNIFTRVSGLVWNFVDSSINFADLNSPSVISIEHNRYFQHAATFSRSGSGSVATFADWLAAVPAQERAAPASRTGDPGFADLMGHDYHLTAASDARLGGVDVLNLRGQGSSTIIPVGAYITGSETVGVRVGISSSRPAAPTNLRRR